MTCIAILYHPSGSILPVTDGADEDVMAKWLDRDAAEVGMADVLAAQAWGYEIIDLDEI